MHHMLKKRVAGAALVSLLLLAGTSIALTRSASAATTQQPPHTQWTPVGHAWTLTVTFLKGGRQGQTEVSLMTFRPDGRLTASFPGSDLQPVNGRWHMTTTHAFHYAFREPILQNGKKVAFVQAQVDAYLTSSRTYEAAGVGVVYAAATGQPVTYNVSQTSARAL